METLFWILLAGVAFWLVIALYGWLSRRRRPEPVVDRDETLDARNYLPRGAIREHGSKYGIYDPHPRNWNEDV